MEYVDRCVKFLLPNGCTLDILQQVLEEIGNWLQLETLAPESCGFLMGYKNPDTGHITLSELTTPQNGDERKRFFCRLRDKFHFKLLSDSAKKRNYYMGIWHTHPQKVPSPSAVDWSDWKDTICKDKTGCEYVFFVIAGTKEFRIWTGEFSTGNIVEIFEAKIIEGVYAKENDGNAH